MLAAHVRVILGVTQQALGLELVIAGISGLISQGTYGGII
jgi:hypothetical protein